MEILEDDDFTKFLEYYYDKTFEDDRGIHSCYDTVEELSRSDDYRADSLVPHPQEMYGLDWMVKCSNELSKNPPKSVDALFFRENYDGNYALHIIEFKFIGRTHQDKINEVLRDIRKKISCEHVQNLDDHSKKNNPDKKELNNNSKNLTIDECENEDFLDDSFVKKLEEIRKNFEDPVKVSLQLKPYEVIYITLPLLYEEYCKENPGVTKKDIVSYLNSIDKFYWAFVGNLSSSYYNIKHKADELNKYSKRLEMTIFKKARVKPNKDFKKVLDREIFENFDYRYF